MLCSKVTLAKDLKEAAKRERVKQYEIERKPRIFDARRRQIGIDVEALERQLQEKREREAEEKAAEKAQADFMAHQAQLAHQLDYQVELNKKRLNVEIDQFRKTYQRAEDRREFDLYDPDYLKKSMPCRLNDSDPRCTLASVQRFEGEDHLSRARRKIQAEQQRVWLTQQMIEKEEHRKQRQMAEEVLYEGIRAREDRVRALIDLERECKLKMEKATAAYNQALAAEQAAAKKLLEQRETEDKQADIYNAITSDMLTENLEVANSNLGVGKSVGCLYKGMTPAQIEEMYETRRMQAEDAKARREAEQREERDWQDLFTRQANNVYIEDKRIQRLEWEKRRELFQQNVQLAKEQKAHREYLDKVVYSNVPTAAYYEQFNKHTR